MERLTACVFAESWVDLFWPYVRVSYRLFAWYSPNDSSR